MFSGEEPKDKEPDVGHWVQISGAMKAVDNTAYYAIKVPLDASCI